jgi:hypothetical protein
MARFVLDVSRVNRATWAQIAAIASASSGRAAHNTGDD